MSLKTQFVELARLEGANVRQLCRRFNISPTTAYKWLNRFKKHGMEGLQEHSRTPKQQPRKTPPSVEQLILDLRDEHPAWGARKLRKRLLNLGHDDLPAVTTFNQILARNGRLNPKLCARPQRDLQRFEYDQPNALWQIDFKGHFPTQGERCHPLSVLDDHSRYCAGLLAGADQSGDRVRRQLTSVFQTHGLPLAILADNGPPWGSASADCPVTHLGVWLLRLGVDIVHGRPYHPQTQGKVERFHRSLKAEVLNRPCWRDLEDCQEAFDQWLPIYNGQRPHDALDGATPDSRYHPSPRSMPTKLPPLEYEAGTITRRVSQPGMISYANQFYLVGRGFSGLDIGLIATNEDGVFDVHLGWKKLGRLDQNQAQGNKANPISIWPGKAQPEITND